MYKTIVASHFPSALLNSKTSSCLFIRWNPKEGFSSTSFTFSFILAQQPPLPLGQGLLVHEVSRSNTTTHHSRYDSSRRVIGSSQRPLPNKTQLSQYRDTNASGGIRIHSLSRRAAADLRLRPRGHWDRLLL